MMMALWLTRRPKHGGETARQILRVTLAHTLGLLLHALLEADVGLCLLHKCV